MKHALLAGLMLIFMMISSSVLFADDQTKKDNSQQELLDRIDTLEKELQKLEEEGKARKSLEVTEEEKGSARKRGAGGSKPGIYPFAPRHFVNRL